MSYPIAVPLPSAAGLAQPENHHIAAMTPCQRYDKHKNEDWHARADDEAGLHL